MNLTETERQNLLRRLNTLQEYHTALSSALYNDDNNLEIDEEITSSERDFLAKDFEDVLNDVKRCINSFINDSKLWQEQMKNNSANDHDVNDKEIKREKLFEKKWFNLDFNKMKMSLPRVNMEIFVETIKWMIQTYLQHRQNSLLAENLKEAQRHKHEASSRANMKRKKASTTKSNWRYDESEDEKDADPVGEKSGSKNEGTVFNISNAVTLASAGVLSYSGYKALESYKMSNDSKEKADRVNDVIMGSEQRINADFTFVTPKNTGTLIYEDARSIVSALSEMNDIATLKVLPVTILRMISQLEATLLRINDFYNSERRLKEQRLKTFLVMGSYAFAILALKIKMSTALKSKGSNVLAIIFGITTYKLSEVLFNAEAEQQLFRTAERDAILEIRKLEDLLYKVQTGQLERIKAIAKAKFTLETSNSLEIPKGSNILSHHSSGPSSNERNKEHLINELEKLKSPQHVPTIKRNQAIAID